VTTKVAHVSTVDLTPRFLLLAQLRALRDAGFEVTSISAPGPWVADLESEGIRHEAWPSATRAWDPRADARAFGELVGILRRGRYDLVHTHNPKPGVMGRLAARIVGVPCVVNTVHGLYATPDDRVRRKAPVLAAEWIAARFSDLELYQSAEDLSWARRLGVVRTGRWTHLGNGLNLSTFEPSLAAGERVAKTRRDLGIADDELVVGTVGRLVAEKGYRELFEAAGPVRRRFPTARFVVVGDRDIDKWDALSEEELRRASADVLFAGWREDVPELMALMDVFVLPSWREGMPRSAIEAAASGTPLVLTDIRGCREVVREGVEGFLVPPRRPDLLARAIERLLDDPGLRVRMGEAARARAEDRFDERRVTATVVGTTRRLLVKSGRLTPREDAEVRVRAARPRDAGAMAALHRRSRPTDFLPQLGDGFLRQLYLAVIHDPRSVALIAERDGAFEGFTAATVSVRAFYRRFATRRGILAAALAAPRLVRPSLIRRARETAGCGHGRLGLPDAELLSIAVHEGSRRRGVGRALEARVRETLGDRGISCFKVVVGTENADANRFYASCGYVPAVQTAVHDGVSSRRWIWSGRRV
jgi:glycosyltransferase involved in cell wall biosynthesis/ribosomal protein S18 acetylase RimI-like enzyme